MFSSRVGVCSWLVAWTAAVFVRIDPEPGVLLRVRLKQAIWGFAGEQKEKQHESNNVNSTPQVICGRKHSPIIT